MKLTKKQTTIVLSTIAFIVISVVGILFSQLLEAEVDSFAPQTFKVTQVVDGDTSKIDKNGVTETVRLVGVDTPETKHPQKGVECFGKEASEKLAELILNKTVYLEYDTEQTETDRYGRLLHYVWVPNSNGTFVNEFLVKEGYAKAYRSAPSKYLEHFIDLENKAREAKKGLWGDECL